MKTLHTPKLELLILEIFLSIFALKHRAEPRRQRTGTESWVQPLPRQRFSLLALKATPQQRKAPPRSPMSTAEPLEFQLGAVELCQADQNASKSALEGARTGMRHKEKLDPILKYYYPLLFGAHIPMKMAKKIPPTPK